MISFRAIRKHVLTDDALFQLLIRRLYSCYSAGEFEHRLGLLVTMHCNVSNEARILMMSHRLHVVATVHA